MKEFAFTLFSKEDECLFMIGKGDIIIKKENNKSIGLKEIEKVDLIGGLAYFMEKMTELFENSLPIDEDDTEEVKKKIAKI